MTDPFEGGYLEVDEDVITSSDANEDDAAAAAGYRVFFIWAGDTDDLTVTGESNNAVFQAASAFTVAAVAGLFF